ncbi:hypothetical protein L2V98_25290, partial [Escherichia coli]|nr:hypothetical protein [Escherichia coli]
SGKGILRFHRKWWSGSLSSQIKHSPGKPGRFKVFVVAEAATTIKMGTGSATAVLPVVKRLSFTKEAN